MEKRSFDTTLQLLITKGLKKEVQKVALENEETVSDIIRGFLEDYINNGKRITNTPKEDWHLIENKG